MIGTLAGLPGIRTWTAEAAWACLFILGTASLTRALPQGDEIAIEEGARPARPEVHGISVGRVY